MGLNLQKKVRQLRLLLWKLIHYSRHKMLQAKGGSLLCNNCTGAMVLHDYGIRFATPTVNLAIKVSDYIELLSNLDYYLLADFQDVTDVYKRRYPVGLLGGRITVHFIHYKSFEEGVAVWKRRISRLDKNNISIVLVQRKGTTEEQLKQFDNLPYDNKVALVNRPMPGIRCAYVIPGFEKEESLGQIIDYVGRFGKRYYDYFPWHKFILRQR